MGLDESVSFTPVFSPQKSSDPNYDLNDLFIKLSGIRSYSNISSGYLQRDKPSETKKVDTSTEHTISQSSTGVKNWKDVLLNLGFDVYGHKFNYLELTNDTAESGYFTITYRKKSTQGEQQRQVETQCRNKINEEVIGINRIPNIRDAERKIAEWSRLIKTMASENKSGRLMTKEENSKEIKKHLDEFQTASASDQYSANEYQSNVLELRKILESVRGQPDYENLSPQCKKLFESEYPKYDTIDEIVSQFYP